MATTWSRFVFKQATDPDEFRQIHRLNYRTFVEEIPQYAANDDGVLVDRFHRENTYHICRDGARVVGMIAVRGTRPFSLDQKLPNLDQFLPPGRSLCELRLLAVDPEYRNGAIFHGLIAQVARYCLGEGFDAAIISGTVRQLKLYRHLGFTPFGPLIGAPDALYQPMYVTLETMARLDVPIASRRPLEKVPVAVSYLPGPVDVHPDVQAAFAGAPVSHRSNDFTSLLQQTRRLLCALTGARGAVIAVGSGTLANDMVAAQLRARGGRGLVLANGEFGERLVDHARRASLDFAVERRPWGASFDKAAIGSALERHDRLDWIWLVHHETSTGVLNDLPWLVSAAAARGVSVCCDCISAIGTMPVDLSGVSLASAVSTKGLGSLPGLCAVFHDGRLRGGVATARYLDLALYAADGPPFTHSSNLLGALRVATERCLLGNSFRETREASAFVRRGLRDLGLAILAPDPVASPAVITIALDGGRSARDVGSRMAHQGYAISYRSDYLLERNWFQIALMGELGRRRAPQMLHELAGALTG